MLCIVLVSPIWFRNYTAPTGYVHVPAYVLKQSTTLYPLVVDQLQCTAREDAQGDWEADILFGKNIIRLLSLNLFLEPTIE